MVDPQMMDRLTVYRDGEEIEVFNWVTVEDAARVRGYNPTVEHFEPRIRRGDGHQPPKAVTKWVAEELEDEYYIDPEEYGIEVIDVDSGDVEVM